MKPTPYDLPDYHALIRGIREIDRAGGDSTVARLVCADWLDEHGEEWRAEMIRSQCGGGSKSFQVDNIPHRVDDRKQSSTRWSAFACPKGSTDHFRMVLPPPPGSPAVWSIRKGFAFSLTVPLAWWLTHGPDTCRRHPVREVVITGALLEDAQAIHREGQDFYYRLAVDGEAVSTPAVRLAQRLSEMALSAGEGDGHLPEAWRETIGKTCLRWAESEADATPGG